MSIITCADTLDLARRILAHPDHAAHAAIITCITWPATEGTGERPWSVKEATPAEALRHLDSIEAGRGNFARCRFYYIKVGTAFALIDPDAHNPAGWLRPVPARH